MALQFGKVEVGILFGVGVHRCHLLLVHLTFLQKKGKVRLIIDSYFDDTYSNYIGIDSFEAMAGKVTIYGTRYSIIFPDGYQEDIGTISYQLYDNDAGDKLTGISISFSPKYNACSATLKFVEVYY